MRALDDTATSARLAEQALEVVQERMTWPVIAHQTVASYQDLIERRGKGAVVAGGGRLGEHCGSGRGADRRKYHV